MASYPVAYSRTLEESEITPDPVGSSVHMISMGLYKGAGRRSSAGAATFCCCS